MTRTSSTAASTVLARPRSAAAKTIRTDLTGPRRHRDRRRRPGREIGPRRSPFLADERAMAGRVLDVRAEVVGRRRVRAVGEVVAEGQRADLGRQSERRGPHRRHAAVDVVGVAGRTGRRAGHQRPRPGRDGTGLSRGGGWVGSLPAPPGRGIGPERVRRSSPRRSRTCRTADRSPGSPCRSSRTDSWRPRSDPGSPSCCARSAARSPRRAGRTARPS